MLDAKLAQKNARCYAVMMSQMIVSSSPITYVSRDSVPTQLI